ncbi:MAG: DUF6515 family protein [Steroidobacterales bacterium]
MMKQGSKFAMWAAAAVAVVGLQGAMVAQAQEGHGAGMRGGEMRGRAHDGRGYVLDGRYNHGHYYPAFGAPFRSLPEGYRPYYFRGSPFYFYGGVWYAPGGPGFFVVRPPVGLVISILPPYYSTLWFGGIPYYYADNVYYTAAPGGYAVVDPPPNADQPGAPPAPMAQGPNELIVYPRNGQTKEQQAADDYECHSWAKGQSGFDPSQAMSGGGGGDRTNYNRAKSACLQARGYEVK